MQPAMRILPRKNRCSLGIQRRILPGSELLAETAGRLLYFPVVPHEVAVNDHVQVINERPIAIWARPMPKACRRNRIPMRWMVCLYCGDAVAPDKLVPGLAVEGGTCKGGCQHGNQPVGLLCLRRSGGEAVPVHQGGRAGQCCSPVGCGMAGKTKEVSVCCAAHDCGFGGPTAGLRR